MLMELATRAFRFCLLGREQDFHFKPVRDIEIFPPPNAGLYIHIPFCKNICPFCPYNKIQYSEELKEPYVKALLAEIEEYYHRIGRARITSIYIGGGTPTSMLDELGVVLGRIRDRFHVTGDVCLETNPEAINRESVNRLVEYGVRRVSLGVQSFADDSLQLLGRNYQEEILDDAIDMLMSANFACVNLDLMFALPGQTLEDVTADIKRAVDSGADQITTYPLFTFPYTPVGRYRKLKKVKMPNLLVRRKMYCFIHNFLEQEGFRRVSVWGFVRGQGPRYSSVTRDHYIGLGAGAGTYVPGCFYLNTFSVEEYLEKCGSGQLPVALRLDFTDLMSTYYWLYWRLYETHIPIKKLEKMYGGNSGRLRWFIKLAGMLGLAHEDERGLSLSERGSFWIHLLQNYYSLNYIDKVWTAARQDPYPQTIRL